MDAVVDRLAEKNFDRLKETLEVNRHLPLVDALPLFVDEVLLVYLDSPRLTRFAFKTATQFGRMNFVIRERDRFAGVVASRLLAELPNVPRADAEVSALALAEMLSGIVMGELYREPDAFRRSTLRTAFLRAVTAELEHLRRIQQQQTMSVPSDAPIAHPSTAECTDDAR